MRSTKAAGGGIFSGVFQQGRQGTSQGQEDFELSWYLFFQHPKQWKQDWKVVNKETSLSESGIHFGHYIVGSKSNIISHYHAAQVTVMLAHGIQLERWSRGLSMMLEKTLGVTLVTKLWAILLMEGDFNAANKIVYGTRMLNNARKHWLMPEEIFSKKTGWPTMGCYARRYFTISPGKQESRRQLHLSMPPTATIE